MVLNSIIHPNLLNKVEGFYPSTATIQLNTPTADSFGELTDNWANIAGLIGIDCSVAPITLESPGAGETRTEDMTLHRLTHHIALRGYFPSILASMRAVVAGIFYDVIAVEHDSHLETTRLKVELVSV